MGRVGERVERVEEKSGVEGEERVGNRVRRMKLQEEGLDTTCCYHSYTHRTGHCCYIISTTHTRNQHNTPSSTTCWAHYVSHSTHLSHLAPKAVHHLEQGVP